MIWLIILVVAIPNSTALAITGDPTQSDGPISQILDRAAATVSHEPSLLKRSSASNVLLSGYVKFSYYFAASDLWLNYGLGGVEVKAIENGTAIETSTVTAFGPLDNMGYYQLELADGWSGTIVVNTENYPYWNIVDPSSIEVDNLVTDAVGQNFLLTHNQNSTWDDDSLPISTANGIQNHLSMSVDGDGGVIIAWEDRRAGTGNSDIYIQRLYSDGDKLWVANGMPICTAPDYQEYPKVASNGYHGGVICWMDKRNGTDHDIYMQRVNAWGDIVLPENGQAVCTAVGEQISPCITTDAAGQAVIAWQDGRTDPSYDIYAMVQSADNVIPICTSTGSQMYVNITPSGPGEVTNGAVIAWNDSRAGLPRIYAQRVDYRTRGVSWTQNGVSISNASGFQVGPSLCSDGNDGAIIAWHQYSDYMTSDVYAQRVKAVDGTPETGWPAGGVVICNSTGNQSAIQMAPDGSGGAVVVWCDERSGTEKDIYAQRVNSTGSVEWSPNGIAVCTETGNQSSPTITASGNGTFVISWVDERGSDKDIYAQQIDLDGDIYWTANGIAISSEPGDENGVTVAADISCTGGVFYSWVNDSGGNSDVYAWRSKAPFSISGCFVTEDGIGVEGIQVEAREYNTDISTDIIKSSTTTDEVGNYTLVLEDGWEGTVVASHEYWDQFSPNVPRYYYALESNLTDQNYVVSHAVGNVWYSEWIPDGNVVCEATGGQTAPQITVDDGGGAIIVWEDNRDSSADIYARKVSSNGEVLWTDDGVLISDAECNKTNPQIASDGSGGGIVTWTHTGGSDLDVYAQRIDSNGHLKWGTIGLPVCNATGDQSDPRIIPDGSGGAFISWIENDGSTGKDIYVTRLDQTGNVATGWPANPVEVCAYNENQVNVDMCLDGGGGVIITWEDWRDGEVYSDIYAQRISSTGGIIWNSYPDGKLICNGDLKQKHPKIISDGTVGGSFIVWEDFRYFDQTYFHSYIYTNRVNQDGVPLYGTNGKQVTTFDDQLNPQIIPSGTNGAIIVWTGPAVFGGQYLSNSVQAQKIGQYLQLEWNSGSPVIVCGLDQDYAPQFDLESDQNEGAIVTYEIDYGGNISSQKVDLNGNIMWRENGLLVAKSTGSQTLPQTVADGTGGVIVAWQDNRSGENDIYAQRVNETDKDLSYSVVFNVPPLDSFLTGCPQGDAGAFEAFIEFDHLMNDIAKEDITLDPPNGDIKFYFDGDIIAANDVNAENDYATSIAHAYICGCGNDVSSVDYDGASLAQREFNLRSYDVNADGIVDIIDMAIIGNALGNCYPSVSYNSCVDYNNDNCVESADYDAMTDHYLHEKPSGYLPQSSDYERPKSKTGVIFSLNEKEEKEGKKLYVTVSLHTVENLSVALLAVNNHHDALKFVKWTPDPDLDAKTLVTTNYRFDHKVLFTGIFGQKPLNGDMVDIGRFEFEILNNRGGYTAEDFRLFVGDMLTADRVPMQLVDVDYQTKQPNFQIRDHLAQNYPNPFNPSTTIEYSIATGTPVELTIYNVLGQRVCKLVDKYQAANRYKVVWDGRNDQGVPVASGAYFCRIKTNNYVNTKKLLLLK